MAGVKREGDDSHQTTNRTAKSAATATSKRVTRKMARSAARHAVFSTTELLESILRQLPLVDLVAVQRISKVFHGCIAGSHKLQMKLFLEPSNDPPERWVAEGRRQQDGQVQWRPAQEHHIDGDWCDILPDDPSRIETPHLLCPILEHEECTVSDQDVTYACNASIDAPFLRSRPDFNLASPGSWRKMYVTAPPCTKIYIEIKHKCWSNARRVSREVRFKASKTVCNADGITFGELLEGASIQPGKLDGYTTKGRTPEDDSDWQLSDYEDFHMPFADIAEGRDKGLGPEPAIEHELRQLWKRFPGIWTVDAGEVSCIIYNMVPSDAQWQAIDRRATEMRSVQDPGSRLEVMN
ncbi:hypothetical protein LTR95_008423 [Oleoguttula sp. CCFEE 5521]